MKQFELTGKNIILTGANGFLGKYIGDMLLDEGAVVCGVDIDCVDLANEESIKNYAELLKSFNITIDGIVNNAAISFKGDNLLSEKFVETMKINVAGVYNLIKEVEPILSKNSSIVNISSVYGVVSPDFRIYEGDSTLYSSSAYGASKAAIIQMTKYYAAQMAPIRVNAVSPGGIYQWHDEKFVKKYSDRTPLKRMAQPEEIVNAILFLLSPLSSYITGHNLIVDGGLTIW